ncbi:hypothetical protein IC229_16595 [Spirosoma sp. BT702]|uniref:DUF4230 domain-containing protein n=1 Tax=Spirosoma profusum TaxID=2771354 RepID=A0A926XWS9_9BACT|nr:hypothetical protein [Spirosoma profusum]MBD2702274.1 hypothetical protein [Spirosoma profusum]
MLQKRVSICLLTLLLCHTLASAIVGVIGWWQAEHDLSERLLMYRSVDSIVEFQIPLKDQTDGKSIARTTEDGFRYRGHYYNVVSLEVQGDKILIAGIEVPNHSFWQDDLLTFLNDHLTTSSDTGRKASQLLKFLLKEYSPGSSTVLHFLRTACGQSVRIPDATFTFSTRIAPIHSPPPELAV